MKNNRTVHFVFSPVGGAGCTSVVSGLSQTTPGGIAIDGDRCRKSLSRYKGLGALSIDNKEEERGEVYIDLLFRMIAHEIEQRKGGHFFVDLSGCILRDFFGAIIDYDIANYFRNSIGTEVYIHSILLPDTAVDNSNAIRRMGQISKHLSPGSAVFWMNRFRSSFPVNMENIEQTARQHLGDRLFGIIDIPYSEMTYRYVTENITAPRKPFDVALKDVDALSRGRLKAYVNIYREASGMILKGVPSVVSPQNETNGSDPLSDGAFEREDSGKEEIAKPEGGTDAASESEDTKDETAPAASPAPAINMDGGEDDEELGYED